MPAPAEWIEYRRGADRELLGWIAASNDGASDGYIAIDLLGHPVTAAVEWLDAEDALETAGIGYLAEAYELRLEPDQAAPLDGEERWVRVRIVEVSADVIRVKTEDWGAIDIPSTEYTLPFPAPARLRLRGR